MRLRNSLKDPHLAGIPKAAWGAYLLTDDLVHRRIQKTAEKIQKNSGIEKKTLSYISFISGSASSAALLYSSPVHSATVAVFSALALIPLRNLIEKASEFRASAGAVADDEVRFAANLLFRAARLPAFIAAAYKLAEGFLSHELHSLSMGAHFLGFSVAAYLVTSSTGMLDKAKNFLSGLGGRLAERLLPGPQPIPVPNR